MPNYRSVKYRSSVESVLAASDFTANISSYISSELSNSIPSGTLVNTTDSQTLTNKTLSGVILNDGFREEVFAVSGTTPSLSPDNGSIQTWTLSGSSNPRQTGWDAGESITLLIDDGAARVINWSTLNVNWKTDGGSAPTLNTSGYTVIVLWKVSTTIYGARVGDA